MTKLSGVLLTLVSMVLIVVFVWAVLTPAYWKLAVTIPVAVGTVGALVLLGYIGWELSKI